MLERNTSIASGLDPVYPHSPRPDRAFPFQLTDIPPSTAGTPALIIDEPADTARVRWGRRLSERRDDHQHLLIAVTVEILAEVEAAHQQPPVSQG